VGKKQKVIPVRPVGQPRKIESPEKLWDLFLGYVQNVQENPWLKVDYVGQKAEKVVIPLAKPITFEGFENYLFSTIGVADIGQYASNRDGRYPEYVSIIKTIRQNCFEQNFNGAAVGAFNANLIARKLGIKDQVDSDIKVSDISDLKFSMKRRE
jgi:hypothetical protein